MALKVGVLILAVLVCKVRLQAIEFISPGQYSYCPSSFLPVAASQPDLEIPVNLQYSQSTQTIIYQPQGIPLQTPTVEIEPSGSILQSLPPSFTFLPPQSVPSQPCSSVNLQPAAEVQLPLSSISLPFPPSYTFLPQPVSFQPSPSVNLLPPAVEITPPPTSVNFVSQIPIPNQFTYLPSQISFQPPSVNLLPPAVEVAQPQINLVSQIPSQNQFTYLPSQFITPVEISPSPSVEVIASTSIPIPSPPPNTYIPFLPEPLQPPSSITLFSPPQISAPINLPTSPVPFPAPTFEIPSPPIILPQPNLQPIFATPPLALPSIPPPVAVQPPTIPNTPLVATNVIKNSLSNSLANLLQLYLATRLAGCQKNGGIKSPFLNDIRPLYNAIGNIGTTNLYTPLIQYPSDNYYDVASIVNPVSYGFAEIPSLDLVPNIYAVTNYPVNFGVADNIGPVIAYY